MPQMALASTTKADKIYILSAVCFAGAVTILPRLALGLHQPYYTLADPDFALVPEALALNSGLAQTFHDHPAYIFLALLAFFLRLIRAVGFTQIADFADLSQFHTLTAVLNELAVSSRIFAMLSSFFCVLIIALLARRLARSWIIASFTLLLLCGGRGVLIQSLCLRPELLSLTLFLLAAGAFLVVPERNSASRQYVMFLASGCFSYLALSTKAQAGLMLLCLPVFSVVLDATRSHSKAAESASAFANLRAVALSVVIMLACSELMAFGGLELFPGPFRWYQLLLIGLIIFALSFRSKKSGRPAWHGASAALTFFAGVSLASLVNLLHPDQENHRIVFQFIDQLQKFCLGQNCAASGSDEIIRTVGSALYWTFAGKADYEYMLEYPYVLLYWYWAIGLVWAYRQRAFDVFWQSGALMVVSLALETAFRLRYGIELGMSPYVVYYYIYAEPFFLFAVLRILAAQLEHMPRAKVSRVYAAVFAFALLSGVTQYVGHARDNIFGLPLRQNISRFCKYAKTPELKRIIESRGECVEVLTADWASID